MMLSNRICHSSRTTRLCAIAGALVGLLPLLLLPTPSAWQSPKKVPFPLSPI